MPQSAILDQEAVRAQHERFSTQMSAACMIRRGFNAIQSRTLTEADGKTLGENDGRPHLIVIEAVGLGISLLTTSLFFPGV